MPALHTSTWSVRLSKTRFGTSKKNDWEIKNTHTKKATSSEFVEYVTEV